MEKRFALFHLQPRIHGKIKTYIQQELLRHKILWAAYHALSWSHKQKDVNKTLCAFDKIFYDHKIQGPVIEDASQSINWHGDYLSFGVKWSVTCNDERAAARVYMAFRNHARIFTSSVDYDDARSLDFYYLLGDSVPSKNDVRTLVETYENDVASDRALAQTLRRRCGLGRRTASGWLLERTPQWGAEYANENWGCANDTNE